MSPDINFFPVKAEISLFANIIVGGHWGDTFIGKFWFEIPEILEKSFSAAYSNQNIGMKVSPQCPPDMIFRKYEISAFTGKKKLISDDV